MAAPIGNTNAEKWNFEKADEMFNEAIILSGEKKDGKYIYDFIGEIARDLGTYKDFFNHMVERFPDLKIKLNLIKSNCEANCYYNGKNNNIVPSLAIMNLKSNHKWTDRVDNTTDGKEVQTTTVINLGSGKEPT